MSTLWTNQNLKSLKKLKQSISFQKNHDNFNLIIINCLIKTNIKQNFVKEKITVWDFEVNFKLYSIICVEITLIQNRVLFFLYKKVLRKRGCKGMAFDALTLQKNK